MTDANLNAVTSNPQIPPMPFGVTLERVYRILRDHLKVFLGIAAPPGVGMILLYGAMFWIMFTTMRPLLSTPADPAAAVNAQFQMMRIMMPTMLVAMIPLTVIFAFYLGAAFFAANKIDSGIGTNVGECFREAWKRLGRWLGLLILIHLRAFGPVLVLEVVSFGLSGLFFKDRTPQYPPVAMFAILPLIWLLIVAASVYGVIVALRLSLAFPASIDEGLAAGEAIRRSNHLTQGSKGRIFLLLLVIELIGMACMIVFEIIGAFVFAIGGLVTYLVPAHSTSMWTVVGTLIAVVLGIVLLVLFYCWIALLYGSLVVTFSVVYHDQRRRMDAPLPIQPPMSGVGLPPGAEPA